MNTWFISDSHFNHANILTFRDKYGNLIRDFRDVEEMNETMVSRWNEKVSPEDKVYHLGDVVMGTSIKAFSILNRLNGRKVLIKGNHDVAKIQRYLDHFNDIRSEIHLKTQNGLKVIFTHRPIKFDEHEVDKVRAINVHGHIHQNVIGDPRYINVSVEVLNYYPINWNEIVDILRSRGFE